MTSSIFLPPQTLLETVRGCSEPMKQVWKLGNAIQKRRANVISYHTSVEQDRKAVIQATCTIGFVQVPINRYTPEVQREDGNTWQEDSTVDISWDSGSI
ncbi:hypothetical protein pdam_00017291 [Pocillopora damicornis]|uniref:Uncharacterized protein n=1 Tax=Pocillopora damicornis TaxID=46731 RepID=A0A3M6U8C3_POCDA|nr:hypothetical protein pdam_00017291 [Pocillopora damicornis]